MADSFARILGGSNSSTVARTTGVPALDAQISGPNASTDTSLGGLVLPPNANSEVIRRIPNAQKVLRTGQQLERQSTEITQASAATTPGKIGRQIDRPVTVDAYRRGQEVPDFEELFNARTLGERAEDKIASLSVTLDFRDQIVDPNSPYSGARGNIVSGYSRFFLQNVAEQQMEKYQIVETFSSYYVFFFGKRPSIYRYSGVLLNDEYHRWTNDMQFFYENYFRGTRNVEFNGHTIIDYDDTVVRGFILGLSVQKSADIERGAPFSIDVLVINQESKKFSPDVKDLIDRRSEELQELREIINNQLSQINRNVPARELLIAKQVGAGKKLPSGLIPKAKADAAIQTAKPISNIPDKVAKYGLGSIA